jgi:Xaa-Pro aminopeptidase
MSMGSSLSSFAASKEDQGQRLEALRQALAAQKLDGFFVPLSDEYMNEYVPDCAQRLAWLTGFTGSAGMALVMKDAAAVVIDGRYTIQATRQVEHKFFEIRHYLKNPLGDFIRQHLKPGQKLGYDPWLHTSPWLEKMKETVEAVQAKLVTVSSNPIDPLWKNRPPPPTALVFAHPLDYAGEESREKRLRLGQQLKDKELAAAVITSPASIAWLLNVRGGDVENTPLPLSYAILHDSGKVDWFANPAKVSAELKVALGPDITAHPQEDFLKALKALGKGGTKVRINFSVAPSAVVDALRDAGAALDRGEDPCELPKACKNKVEVEGMRAAHKRDGLALTKFLCWLDGHAPKGGVDEISAEEKLLEIRKQNNSFLYPSFPSISGAGPNGAVVHYRASNETNRPLHPGEFYLIDSGGQYADGTTDVTRTVSIAEVTPEMRAHFTRVLKGHIALAAARFPAGTTGGQLDVLARQFLWQAGLDYDHGTGHGVGAFLGVHEGPQSISGRSTSVALQPGMVVSNEPGYYKEGAYGIRIENLVVVKESAAQLDGKPMLEFETLTLAPIDVGAIDKSLLTPPEKQWLNEYHTQVFEAHQDKLTPPEREWLEMATKPI